MTPTRRSQTAPPFEAEKQSSDGLSLGVPPELVEALADAVADRLAERTAPEPEPYLTPEDAAAYLACRKPRIYELVEQGRLAHFRDGKRLLFARADLDAALDRKEIDR